MIVTKPKTDGDLVVRIHETGAFDERLAVRHSFESLARALGLNVSRVPPVSDEVLRIFAWRVSAGAPHRRLLVAFLRGLGTAHIERFVIEDAV